jgi:hypothetical protein
MPRYVAACVLLFVYLALLRGHSAITSDIPCSLMMFDPRELKSFMEQAFRTTLAHHLSLSQRVPFEVLLRPFTMNTIQETVSTPFQDNVFDPLVAVCGRMYEESPSGWKGVFKWKLEQWLPDYTREMLIIV